MITVTYGTVGNSSSGSGVYQINPMLDFCGIMGMEVSKPETTVVGATTTVEVTTSNSGRKLQ